MKIQKLAAKALCCLLSFQIAFHPLLVLAADITVDAAADVANKATVTTARNGVPLVNIVAPNGAGLSHNKFTDYNVTAKGLILNNSTAIGSSKLGGILTANPNFSGTAATKILNEVTGSSRSQLKGFTEVFGSKADVIVANQNGITCNGCGFINTGRTTLTTGMPTFTGSALTGFDVNAGDIAIEGLGLDASQADAFDVIARSTTIAAKLKAQELNLITGRNTVDYDSRTATAKDDDGSEKPTFAIDSTALGGMYAGRIAIVATEAGVGVNMGGEAAASVGDMTLTADGKIVLASASAKGDLSITSAASTIDVGARSHSGGATTLTADGKITTATSTADGALTLTSNNGAVEVQTLAQSGGTAALSAKGDVALASAKSVGNLTVTSSAGAVNVTTAAYSEGNTTLTAATGLDLSQSSTGAAGDVTLSGTSINATDAQVIAGLQSDNTLASSGTLTATTAGALAYGSGQLAAGSAVNITAGSTSGTGGAGGTAPKGINSQGTVTINATTVSDTGGGIQATGDITINATNATISGGNVESTTGAVDLNVTGTLTNSDQRISAKTTLAADANDIVNNGQMNAQGALNIAALNNLTNRGFIYFPGDISIYAANTLLNDGGDILADGSITLQGTAAGANATLISNQSGSIEALNGDITIKADTLKNERKNIAFTTTDAPDEGGYDNNMSAYSHWEKLKMQELGLMQGYTSPSNGYWVDTNVSWISFANRGIAEWRPGGYENDGDVIRTVDESGWSDPRGLFGRGIVAVIPSSPQFGKWATPNGDATETIQYKRVTGGDAAPTIAAGRNISIEATDTINTGGRISANGDLSIVGTNLTNTGFDEVKETSRTATKVILTYDCWSPDDGGCSTEYYYPKWTTSTSTSSVVTSTTNAVISARGNFLGSFTGQVDNKTIVANGSLKDIKQGSESALKKTLDFGAVDPAQLTQGITVPTSQNGLFIPAQNPDSSYLIETNPAFADMGTFMGSDYFLEAAGLDKNAVTKRLGDAFYETKLIREEIFSRTGKRFLADNVTSDADQMQSLMDSAVAQKDGLNLSFGVALTPDQVAALSGDMVWWVDVEVAGQTVSRPVLYLADATRAELTPSGAIITANSMTLDAETLANSGALVADTSLTATVTDSIVNRYGDIKGKDGVTLVAANDITNTGGLIKSDADVSLTATNGSIINQAELRTESRHFANGISWGRDTKDKTGVTQGIGAQGRIQSGNNLTLAAAQDITNRAGILKAANDISLTAAGNVNLDAQAARKDFFTHEDAPDATREYRTTRVTGTTRYGGAVTAGNNLSVEAGKNLTVEGTALTAGKNVALSAGENLTVASASSTETRSYSKWGRQYKLNNSETASTILAGNNLTATAANGLSVQASNLEAANDIALTGATGVNIEAKAVRSGWQMSDAKDLSTTHKSANVTAGGNVTVNATLGNVDVRGSNIKGQDTTLNALGSVTVDKVQNTRETAGAAGDYWTETYQLRNKGAKVEATNDLTLNATLGNVTVDASSLKSGGVTTLNAATGKVELLASKDVDYTRTWGTKDGGLWITTVDRGSYDETVKHTTIDAGGSLVINAGNGITVDYKGGGGVDGAVEALSKQPGLSWMAEIKNRDDVTWNAVQEAHRSWDFKSQSLNPAAGAVIAIAVSLATANPTAALAEGLVKNTVMQAALKAGMMSLASTASVSLVANKGDLGKTLKDLGSSSTLRSLASAMVTAGLLEGVMPAELNKKVTELALPQKLQKFIIETSVKTAVKATIGGQDMGETFKSTAMLTTAQYVGAELSNEIGELAADDKINEVAQVIAHAALGCGMGAMSGGDCASGAIGGAAGELVGLATKNAIETGDLTLSEAEVMVDNGVDMATMVSAVVAAIAGRDPNTAAMTGANAAENNALKAVTTAIKILAKVGKKAVEKGKISASDLEKASIDELVGFIEDGYTLADPDATKVDKGIAALSILLGVDKGMVEGLATWIKSYRQAKHSNDVPLLTGPSQLDLNKISGQKFQAAVHDALRLPENKGAVTVELPGGSKVTTIPDLLSSQTGVTDVKNVINISDSDQLRAQFKLAIDSGQPFNLVISPRTETISGPLSEKIRQAGGEIFQFDASTNTFSSTSLVGNKVMRP